jgi:hypothetical protein
MMFSMELTLGHPPKGSDVHPEAATAQAVGAWRPLHIVMWRGLRPWAWEPERNILLALEFGMSVLDVSVHWQSPMVQ